MVAMIGIYFSGTGNTKRCVERFVKFIDGSAVVLPLESDSAKSAIAKTNVIVFGYGVQYANLPFFVREFIVKNKGLWKGKNVFIVTTAGIVTGDGTGCGARLLKKYGAKVLGGMQIRMPHNVCDYKEKKEDVPLSPDKLYLKNMQKESELKKLAEENKKLIKAADEKVDAAVKDFKRGVYPQEGLNLSARISGAFTRRFSTGKHTGGYSDKLKINEDVCDGCRICAEQCPMHNITIEDGKAHPNGKCTACYRCINRCPKKAITLNGDKIDEQYRIEKFCR